jgi:hypothetical protein
MHSSPVSQALPKFSLQQYFCDILNMFYEGDLQSGISKAVQEAKLVACFVTGTSSNQHLGRGTDKVSLDDGEESQLWENKYLKDDSVSILLAFDR